MPNGNAAHNIEEENLRLPKTTSKAAITRKPQVPQPESSVFAYSISQSQGRGRGMATSNPVNNGNFKVLLLYMY